jgi:hypothetical protein
MIRPRTIAFVASLYWPATAFAQSPADLAARQSLVAEADAASLAGDHARALDLALRASRIQMTPSLQLLLAREHRQLGQLVAAYADALACARGALADASLRSRETILSACQETARELEPQLGRVRVSFPADAPAETQLRVADDIVPDALRDQPRVVLPGTVRVRATAAGRAPFEQQVHVTAGSTVDVRVTWPVVIAGEAPPPRGPGVAPWIVVGVGAAGLAAAGVFFGLASSAQSERDGACTAGVGCLPVAKEHDARYRDDALYGNFALGVGAALVVGGVVWYLVARPRASAVASSAPFVIRF